MPMKKSYSFKLAKLGQKLIQLASDQINDFTNTLFEAQSDQSVASVLLFKPGMPELPIRQDTEEIDLKELLFIDRKSENEMSITNKVIKLGKLKVVSQTRKNPGCSKSKSIKKQRQ